MAREYKSILHGAKEFDERFRVKAVDDEKGIIQAYASKFGNLDEYNDIVVPGSYKRTLTLAHKAKRPYLYTYLFQHDPNSILGGIIDAEEDDLGLLYQAQMNLDTQLGREQYSNAKMGVIYQSSIGYDIPSGGAEYKDGVRYLKEIRLWEISLVTFAANPEATVVDVKHNPTIIDRPYEISTKSVTGNTSGPIGPRDEAWDGSKAEGQIWDAAYNDETDKINTSLAKKYFMSVDGDAQKKGSYSLPFWYVGSDPHICVGAVKAIAAAAQGARNASVPDGVKAKVETLYNRINKKYSNDPELTPPWNNDGKRSRMNISIKEKKTFLEHLSEEMAEDLLEDWQDVLICALSCSVLDAFRIGDQPEADIREALAAFNDAVMVWVAQGIEYGLSDYLEENTSDYSLADHTIQYGSDSQPNYGHGYMSRRRPDAKAMTAGDATTGGFTTEHVDKLKSAASKAMKAAQAHADGLHEAADTVTKLVDGANKEKGRALPYGIKAGRTFSSANVQALSDHADSLHDMADAHTKAMTRYTKAVNTVADDLAETIQGAEPAYGTDPGDAGDRQEGKTSQRTPFNDRTRTTQQRSSHDDTVTEDEIVAALGKLAALKTV